VRTLAIAIVLLVAGCGVARTAKRIFTPTSRARVACIRYSFCGPRAGGYAVGSTICYYDDSAKPDGERKEVCD
jgi:hypothetical protein